MIITHNMASMNANRQFNNVSKKKRTSMEKLSSGYQINRSADDAAGLSISEKMRRQIRGLSQWVENNRRCNFYVPRGRWCIIGSRCNIA